MNNKEENSVIVRGINKDWFVNNFKDMEIHFEGDYRAIPAYNADFIGFYLESPISAITHIGIVNEIKREPNSATFYLKAIIKLDSAIPVADHAIRKQEYWTLKELGINNIGLILNDFKRMNKA
jgi:hypothetical protein